MAHGDVWAALRQRNLDAGRAPGDESCQSALPNAQQTLMHVRGVDLALDDVENGDVAALLAGNGRHHAVLRLEQPSHHVEDGCLPHRLGLFDLVPREGRVRRHEEVASGCRDQRGQNADEVIVHVAGVS